jgi:hypothetical protein
MLRKILERTLLIAAGLIVALVVLEVAARSSSWVMGGQRLSSDEYRSAMLAAASDGPSPAGTSHAGERQGQVTEFLHPYLGFVPDPSTFQNRTTIGDPGQILPASDDTLIVGIFGGSFAAGVCHFAGGELRRALARPGKDVRLLCVSAGGYKQPQQFLALAYLLAQGAHFDLVINLDGFNEVALPPDNVQKGVAPIYPQAWLWRIGNVSDASALKSLGELSIVDRDRRAWAERFAGWQSDRSALLSLVWEKLDRVFAARRAALLAAIQSNKMAQRKRYVGTGPTMQFADPQSLYAYLARVWSDSSVQMKLLCEANHVEYAHFLQPNQHVVGSKPVAPEEVRLVAGQSAYKNAVVGGYPVLRQQGEELRRAGVAFHDLTMVFENVQEPLYIDSCCHLNPAGYARIARVIGDTVRAGGDGTRSDAAVSTQP